MSSAIGFNLDQSENLSSGNGLKESDNELVLCKWFQFGHVQNFVVW